MDMSVIIPCHNLEKFITPLLVSLRLQVLLSYKVELIFVCDACEDNTKKIIENFNFNNIYENVKIIECNHKSCGLARDEGMEQAEGKYIWFMDGDDWLVDIHAIVQVIDTLGITKSPMIRFDYEAPGFAAKGHLSMVWQYGYERDFIKDVPFDAEQPHEDLRFNNKLFEKIDRSIPYLDEVLYHYNYMRENSNMYQFKKSGTIEY